MREKTNLEKIYDEQIVPKMMKKFGYKNRMQVPKLTKVVVNMGVGKASEDIKILEDSVNELTIITGQKPVITRAKKSISNFKIRKGQPIGCYVTLRRNIMYEFVDRLVNVALTRIRDFRGVSMKGFDQHGNYTLGLKEQSVFPEVTADAVTKVQGMDVTFVTTAENKDESMYLLHFLGMPFRGKVDRLTVNE